jgi:hypothetical protein
MAARGYSNILPVGTRLPRTRSERRLRLPLRLTNTRSDYNT